jgi:hypothetical protein
MSQLRAFVGHSFAPEDHQVIDVFLRFLNQIKGMGIDFTWETAEPAEPKEVAEKVLRLIRGKNLFIGICTKREAAIAPGNLVKGRFIKNRFKTNQEHISWKTSDWIVQEIGLAIGCGMERILLVEDGLRALGGLQGNLEYIPFEREAPEKAFGKLLEMIRTQLPRAKAIPPSGVENQAISEETAAIDEEQIDDWLEPKEEWHVEDYNRAIFHMIFIKNPDGEKRITEVFFNTKEGKIEANRQRWEARVEHLRITLGRGGKLAKLEELAKKYRENSDVQMYLGMGYEHYQEHGKAAQCFITAAEKAEDKRTELARFGDSAYALVRASQKDQGQEVITKMKALLPQVEDGEVVLLKALRRIAESENEKDLSFGLTERLLQLNPDDSESRFSLAHSYAQTEQNELSLFHYLRIPYEHRSPGAWNNLGVQFDQCNLSSKSVEAYRRAEGLGETLAMSNLAYKFINAGFLPEAGEICDRAIKTGQYHKNVGLAISKIKAVPDEEQRNEKQILDKARPLSDFYREYGRAVVREDVFEQEGRWRGPDCELTITIHGSTFEAVGNYDVSESGLRLSQALAGVPAPPPKITRYSVKYTGKMFGHAVNSNVLRQEVVKSSTLLGEMMNTKKALMIISESLREIRVYEKDSANKGSFYNLTRLE